jgi:hypothetical protein
MVMVTKGRIELTARTPIQLHEMNLKGGRIVRVPENGWASPKSLRKLGSIRGRIIGKPRQAGHASLGKFDLRPTRGLAAPC